MDMQVTAWSRSPNSKEVWNVNEAIVIIPPGSAMVEIWRGCQGVLIGSFTGAFLGPARQEVGRSFRESITAPICCVRPDPGRNAGVAAMFSTGEWKGTFRLPKED